jgi:hypothetical protein
MEGSTDHLCKQAEKWPFTHPLARELVETLMKILGFWLLSPNAYLVPSMKCKTLSHRRMANQACMSFLAQVYFIKLTLFQNIYHEYKVHYTTTRSERWTRKSGAR